MIIMLRFYFFSFLILSCFVFNACLFSAKPIYYEDDKRVAIEHIQKFHTYLNNTEYERIYDLFDEKIKSQQSKEQFIQRLRDFRENAGAFKSNSILKIDINPQAKVRLVHIVSESEFEKKRVLEEFDCFVDGQKAVFDFYGHPEKVD